jgi:hypothetical protein
MQRLVLALVLIAGSLQIARADLLTTNLLLNPGAETGNTTNWVIGGVSNPGVTNGTFDPGINPHSGSYDFFGRTGAEGTLSQRVYLPGNQGITSALIDAGLLAANVSFWEQGLSQGTPSDEARVIIAFLDSNTNLISTNATPFLDSHNLTWQNYSNQYAVPIGTRLIVYTMDFFRNDGSDNDSFIDDNVLTVASVPIPLLSIFPAGSNVVVSWPVTTAAYAPESTPTLSSPDWTSVTNEPTVIGGTNFITNAISGVSSFFRLSVSLP